MRKREILFVHYWNLSFYRFLESMTPPVKVDETKVQRWHPKFKLEELPEVTPAALPKAPEVAHS